MDTFSASDLKARSVDIWQEDGSKVSGLQVTDIESVRKNCKGNLPPYIIINYDLHVHTPSGHAIKQKPVLLSLRDSRTGGFYKQVTPNEKTLGSAYVPTQNVVDTMLAEIRASKPATTTNTTNTANKYSNIRDKANSTTNQDDFTLDEF